MCLAREGKGRVCGKVRVTWCVPRLSVGVMPLHRRMAAWKIAEGCVGLLGHGVAEVRRCGCPGLGGYYHSLWICDRWGGLAGVVIACNKQILQGGDVGVLNKNYPWGARFLEF